MTAICGALGGEAQALGAMQAVLADYGSAGAGWHEGDVGLRCRGADGESRHHVDAEAGLVVVADARIDDREGLSTALGIRLAERAALADAALILRAFARWGADCPRHLLGDYAFAVWDQRKHTLFCARDHIGARPLYYAHENGQFAFASAVEALLALPDVPDALDETMVATRLGTTLCSDTRTLFHAVHKLPPGNTLTVERSRADGWGQRLERYWFPEHAPVASPASDEACIEQFLHLYRQAVRDRLRGGPVGTHLSGGLDSSSIAVLAARESRRQGRPPPLAFTWLRELGDAAPEPAHAPEYALVDAVCAQENLQVCHGALNVEDVLALLSLDGALPNVLVHVNEEIVQRHAEAQGIKVLLSGWGGDECVSFGGIGHWQQLLLSGRWRQLAAEGRAQNRPAWRFFAGVALPVLLPSLAAALRQSRTGRSRRPGFLIDPTFARRVKPLAAPAKRTISVRREQLWRLRQGHLAERIEGWAASAAGRGIEYRYPLLDRRLLEFALGLPPDRFQRGEWSRWLMRHALQTILPPDVCWNRSKRDPARSEPLIDAYCAALPEIRRRLAEHPPPRAGYVDMPALRECLAQPQQFRARPGRVMRALHFLDFQAAA